jgi:hypothetical protein
MRMLVSLILGASVLGLAFWAYQENYKTRQALADVRAMQQDIGRLGEQLRVLRAEWAYLNRPERLRELADLNFELLRLMPMAPEHFGRLEQVSYPVAPAPEPLPLAEGAAEAAPVALTDAEAN